MNTFWLKYMSFHRRHSEDIPKSYFFDGLTTFEYPKNKYIELEEDYVEKNRYLQYTKNKMLITFT